MQIILQIQLFVREKFSFKLSISTQNSGWGRVFMNAFRQLRPARGGQGVTVMLFVGGG